MASLFSSLARSPAAIPRRGPCARMLKLNESTAGVDPSLPFGGWKASGLGPPEHGEGDRLFYTRLQAVYGRPRPARTSLSRPWRHDSYRPRVPTRPSVNPRPLRPGGVAAPPPSRRQHCPQSQWSYAELDQRSEARGRPGSSSAWGRLRTGRAADAARGALVAAILGALKARQDLFRPRSDGTGGTGWRRPDRRSPSAAPADRPSPARPWPIRSLPVLANRGERRFFARRLGDPPPTADGGLRPKPEPG